jgi:hypothetical protein
MEKRKIKEEEKGEEIKDEEEDWTFYFSLFWAPF